jgi:hypothetical protein
MKQQTVYWSNLTELSSDLITPLPLLPYIAKSQEGHKHGNHISCPAIRNRHTNTFFTSIPYKLQVDFKEGKFLSTDRMVSPRPGLYESSFAFDWPIGRIFFSDISQILEVSPAYLHETSYSQFGHAPSGSFDIGSWFRPSWPTFQLWPGKKNFSAQKGEAHLYFNFPSKNKIILKEFTMSPKLYEIMYECVNYKQIKPNQNLPNIYQMFKEKGLNNIISKEIKNNLGEINGK